MLNMVCHQGKGTCESFSRVWLFATPRTVALQVPLSVGSYQARILEWVAIPFSSRSSQVSCVSYWQADSLPLAKCRLKQVWKKVLIAQLCLTLCNPMDYTIYGILQARILEWVAFPFSSRSSQPRDWTQVSRIAGGFFTSWVTREAHF